MRVYISVDMEGCAGIVHVDQTRRTGHDYGLARRWMTGEANAAALGAFEAGAERVVINDSHGDMRNLLLDELDPRVEVVSGSLKHGSMVEGIGGGFECALFVGYHAGAGTARGVLDHTYFGRVVHRVHVNGRHFNEAGLNALVAGAAGVPVVLVTGDSVTCEQSRALVPGVQTVAVKEGLSRYAARSLVPTEACRRIRAAAAEAVAGAGSAVALSPPGPFALQVELHDAGMADAAMLLPGADRHGACTVGYRADDPDTMLRALQTITILADSVRLP
jgi:D-amino peptidase